MRKLLTLTVILSVLGMGYAFPESPTDRPHCDYVVIASCARTTYYGNYFTEEMRTKSGEFYGHGVALGPDLLGLAREVAATTWKFPVRVTNLETGRWAIYEVHDTGLPKLALDIPTKLWYNISGKPYEHGVFFSRIEVVVCR